VVSASCYCLTASSLTLFYTCGLGIAVSHLMDPFDFLQRYGNLTILKFSFKWVKVLLPYREGGGLPVVGGGSLVTHICMYSAGSVTTQRTAFKHVMASEPYRYTWYIFLMSVDGSLTMRCVK
jgi:hypothetical protein